MADKKIGFDKFASKQSYGGRVAIATPVTASQPQQEIPVHPDPKPEPTPAPAQEPKQSPAAAAGPVPEKKAAANRGGRPRKREEDKNLHINLSVPPELKARLTRYKEKNYRATLTEVIIQAVVEFLDRHEA